MAVYEYAGLDAKGKKTSGLVDADSSKAARQKLRKQGVFTTSIAEGKGSVTAIRTSSRKVGGGGGASDKLSTEVDFAQFFTRITVQDIALSTRQLAALLGAGIPLVESLGALAEQVEKERFRIILREIREKVNEGSTLADALKGYPKVFNNLYVNMVRAGEQAGALEHVLGRLADYTEATVELRGKVMASLTYPLVMLGVAAAVITFLMAYVVPKITKLFRARKAELPWITEAVLFVSDALKSYWWLFGMLAIGGTIGFIRYYRTEDGREKVDRTLLKIPIFGKMLRMIAISRFTSTLATLMSSGVPLLSAMGIVRNIVNNVVLKSAIGDAQEAVREGEPMNRPLARSGEFPPMVVHMISVGERTGELSEMLGRIAKTYESQVNRRLTTLTALLEPLMILLMGGIVFIIALAILLPMLDIQNLGSRF
ncbi:MAG: type II secretion system inner membrane protein GspF [Proteobacteria bacterium]|nr:type II secretion system inner membrane protein GspF [Pseudomonadota bacterium]